MVDRQKVKRVAAVAALTGLASVAVFAPEALQSPPATVEPAPPRFPTGGEDVDAPGTVRATRYFRIVGVQENGRLLIIEEEGPPGPDDIEVMRARYKDTANGDLQSFRMWDPNTDDRIELSPRASIDAKEK